MTDTGGDIDSGWRLQFQRFEVEDFPVVRIEGSRLPQGYGPQWVAEMDALLGRGDPFVFVFLSNAENQAHEDQKAQTLWLKRNKTVFAGLCRGAVSIEPDPVRRLLKRAQALAITTAFGVRFSVASDRDEAEACAMRLLAGDETLPDDE